MILTRCKGKAGESNVGNAQNLHPKRDKENIAMCLAALFGSLSLYAGSQCAQGV